MGVLVLGAKLQGKKGGNSQRFAKGEGCLAHRRRALETVVEER